MRPYYNDGQCVVYHGDVLDVLSDLGKFDLIVTSPPYNLGVTSGGGFGHWKPGDSHGGMGKWRRAAEANGIGNGYEGHGDAMPPAEYEEWQRDVLAMCWISLTPNGAIFYNHKPRVQSGSLWLPLAVNPGLPVRQIIVWARSGGMNFSPTHYVPTYEWIIVFAGEEFRLTSRGASGVGDVWRFPQEANPAHPAPFPVGLPARAIETTNPASVLDPFVGSGTTLVAAKAAGIPAVGIDISERYCEIAAKRLAQGVLDFNGAPTTRPVTDAAASLLSGESLGGRGDDAP